MKLLAESNGHKKPREDQTADTASTQKFKRKARLIHSLEQIIPRSPDDEMERLVRVGILVDSLTRYIGDPYITHLVFKVVSGKKKHTRKLVADIANIEET